MHHGVDGVVRVIIEHHGDGDSDGDDDDATLHKCIVSN